MKKVFFAAIAAMVMVSVSNVFASSKMMMGNASVAPVDTVAPATPADSSVVDAPAAPQAGVEDDTTKQETPVQSVDNTQSQTPVQEENTPQEETTENQQPTEQNTVSE